MPRRHDQHRPVGELQHPLGVVAEVAWLSLDARDNHLRCSIAGRADPPLPLARLRVRGELVELRAADLRFRPGEVTEYLTEAVGLALSAGQVAALDSRTEGWIAAL